MIENSELELVHICIIAMRINNKWKNPELLVVSLTVVVDLNLNRVWLLHPSPYTTNARHSFQTENSLLSIQYAPWYCILCMQYLHVNMYCTMHALSILYMREAELHIQMRWDEKRWEVMDCVLYEESWIIFTIYMCINMCIYIICMHLNIIIRPFIYKYDCLYMNS